MSPPPQSLFLPSRHLLTKGLIYCARRSSSSQPFARRSICASNSLIGVSTISYASPAFIFIPGRTFVAATPMRCNDAFEIVDADPMFVMPPYTQPESYTVSPSVEKIFREMLTLQPRDVAIIGHVLMHRLGIPNEEMMKILQARLGGYSSSSQTETISTETVVVEEKKVFDLKLMGFDEKSKIKVIKEIRAVTGLGLKEAKDLVEGAPKVIKKDIKKEEADEIKDLLTKVGAIVEIV